MSQPYVSLQPSEAAILAAASRIYSAYITCGAFRDDQKQEWMKRAIREAITMAKVTDEAVQSDNEL